MHFKILRRLRDVEVIATETAIREHKRLWKFCGKARRRKLKGIGDIEFSDGTMCEAHAVGAKEYKVKRIIESE